MRHAGPVAPRRVPGPRGARRALAVLGLVAACAGGDGPSDDVVDETDDTQVAGPTFHRDVRPLLDRHCNGCHAPGGIGTMSLVWDEADPTAIEGWFEPVARSVAQGTMPPWPPDEACHPTASPRVLPEAARATIAAWAEAGHPVGDPATYVPPRITTPEVPAPDLTLRAGAAYTPERLGTDDYRCFVLDHAFEDDVWMQGFDVRPGEVGVVHHVLLYKLPAELAEAAATWDAAEEGPGYTCFGAPAPDGVSFPGLPQTMAGWAPGQAPERYEEVTARRIEAGSVLVMQVHYNVTNLLPEQPTPADRTSIDLWLRDPGDEPFWELFSLPMPKTDLFLPAGEANVVQELTIDVGDYLPPQLGVVHVRGTFPHMHELGTSIRADVIREDGSEICMVDVPRWDFAWQQSYLYPFEPTDTTIPIGSRSKIRLRCTFDNSAANQPLVDGVPRTPRDVTWGERTEDEMCLVYVYAMIPADHGTISLP